MIYKRENVRVKEPAQFTRHGVNADARFITFQRLYADFVNAADIRGHQNMTDDELTRAIIGCAYKVHNALGPGFLEKVYENALRIELEKLGSAVKQQQPVNVLYDGHFVGQYYADLWINERIVIELRAIAP